MRPNVVTPPNVKQAVPFFGVVNIYESQRFYLDGIGFKMTKSWVPDGKLRWCWLQLGDAAIMLQEFRKDGEHVGAPDGKLGSGVSICFICEDALEVYRDARSRGVEASRPFVGNGVWVKSKADPDGYRIDFESPTDVPEEMQYSEGELRINPRARETA